MIGTRFALSNGERMARYPCNGTVEPHPNVRMDRHAFFNAPAAKHAADAAIPVQVLLWSAIRRYFIKT